MQVSWLRQPEIYKGLEIVKVSLGNIMICCLCMSLCLLATVGQRILDQTDL